MTHNPLAHAALEFARGWRAEKLAVKLSLARWRNTERNTTSHAGWKQREGKGFGPRAGDHAHTCAPTTLHTHAIARNKRTHALCIRASAWTWKPVHPTYSVRIVTRCVHTTVSLFPRSESKRISHSNESGIVYVNCVYQLRKMKNEIIKRWDLKKKEMKNEIHS